MWNSVSWLSRYSHSKIHPDEINCLCHSLFRIIKCVSNLGSCTTSILASCLHVNRKGLSVQTFSSDTLQHVPSIIIYKYHKKGLEMLSECHIVWKTSYTILWSITNPEYLLSQNTQLQWMLNILRLTSPLMFQVFFLLIHLVILCITHFLSLHVNPFSTLSMGVIMFIR